MQHFLVVLLLILLSGCATPQLGEPFNYERDARVDSAQSVLVIFADASIEEGIAYTIWFNNERLNWVFPNSFIRIVAAPGTSEVGFGEYVPNPKLFAPHPESFTMLSSPFPSSFSDIFGPPYVKTIDLKADEVFYIRIRKDVNEVFKACGQTKETTAICSTKKFTTVIERVDETDALQALAGMRESL